MFGYIQLFRSTLLKVNSSHYKKELIDDESKFYQYIRMTMYSFNKLLNVVKSEIQRQDTRFRKCISPRHRLAVTLR